VADFSFVEELKMQKTLIDRLSDWVESLFRGCFGDRVSDYSMVGVAATGNATFGDYQCNAAMPLAKQLGCAPRAIAEEVVAAAQSQLPEGVARVEIAGPGFINIFLDDRALGTMVSELVADGALGVPQVGEGKTIVMDYSSPNVAKPMHIGHIRSTIIGNSIDRMFRMLGYRVVADNHIGDWGTQFGIIIMGYRNFLDEKALAEAPVEELERVYVKSYERTQRDPEWLAACRNELVKLQQGDAENRALWERFITLSLGEFDRVYGRLGVSFDLVRGESYYHDRLAGMVERLESAGLASESEGATVVFLEDEGLPVCIVRKSDGGFNYATTDLATVVSRVEEFDPERIIYVTDERQQLHFKQFFTVARKLGVTTALEHVWFGLMRLPEATFSTRQGNVIKLEALLDEAEERALKVIQGSSPDMPEAQQREVARSVGIGAVKYADLSQNPQTTVVFTWDKALALDGNSGPYLQYAHARIASVQEKYAQQVPNGNLSAHRIAVGEAVERALCVHVLRFPETVMRAAQAYKPSTLADYLYELAQLYSSFYQNVPFLKAEEGVRESRVLLCGAVARVLKQGLELLGLEAPDRI
jgi:arginyl-tRNA synthetase